MVAWERTLRPAGRNLLPGALRCSRRIIPNYAGDLGIGPNPKLAARVKSADLLVMVSARLSEDAIVILFAAGNPDTTAKSSFTSSRPRKNLDVFTSLHWPFRRRPARFAAAVAGISGRAGPGRCRRGRRSPCRVSGMVGQNQESFQAPFNMARVIVWLRNRLPPDAIVCNGRRQLHHMDSSLLPLPRARHSARADQRIDGLRSAGGRPGQTAISESRGSGIGRRTAIS